MHATFTYAWPEEAYSTHMSSLSPCSASGNAVKVELASACPPSSHCPTRIYRISPPIVMAATFPRNIKHHDPNLNNRSAPRMVKEVACKMKCTRTEFAHHISTSLMGSCYKKECLTCMLHLASWRIQTSERNLFHSGNHTRLGRLSVQYHSGITQVSLSGTRFHNLSRGAFEGARLSSSLVD